MIYLFFHLGLYFFTFFLHHFLFPFYISLSTEFPTRPIYIYIYIRWSAEKFIGWRGNFHEWGLFFNIVPIAIHTFRRRVLQYLDPIGQKKSSVVDIASSYNLFKQLTFQSIANILAGIPGVSWEKSVEIWTILLKKA